MIIRSQSAVRFRFFTRRSGRTETCGYLLSSTRRRPDIRTPTRNPFVKMSVKAITWRTPQERNAHVMIIAAGAPFVNDRKAGRVLDFSAGARDMPKNLRDGLF